MWSYPAVRWHLPAPNPPSTTNQDSKLQAPTLTFSLNSLISLAFAPRNRIRAVCPAAKSEQNFGRIKVTTTLANQDCTGLSKNAHMAKRNAARPEEIYFVGCRTCAVSYFSAGAAIFLGALRAALLVRCDPFVRFIPAEGLSCEAASSPISPRVSGVTPSLPAVRVSSCPVTGKFSAF